MYVTLLPLDNIFIMKKKGLPQKTNMFQKKFEWVFNRSHLNFSKNRNNATFEHCLVYK